MGGLMIPGPRFVLVLPVLSSGLLMREGDLVFVHTPLNLSTPTDSAIQAVGYATIDWLAQHGTRSFNRDTAVHVALAVGDNELIEAVPEAGVRTLPLTMFFNSF